MKEIQFMQYINLDDWNCSWCSDLRSLQCHNERNVAQITSLTIVYSTIDSDTDERKHQSSASLVFVRGIHRWPVNSPHKGPVTRKMFPFDDVIKRYYLTLLVLKQKCSRMTRSMQWLSLPQSLASPGHQQSGYWPYRVNGSWALAQYKDHLSQEWGLPC